MNFQNKISGRAVCTVGLVQELFDGEKKFVKADAGILWRLNPDTLSEFLLSDSTIDDFIAQLEEFGTIEDLRHAMGLSPFAGAARGPVLRHRERPEVSCMVTIMSGPNTGYNPNVYNYPYDIMLDCFIDMDNAVAGEYREIENELNFIGALSDRRIGSPIGEDVAIDCTGGEDVKNYKEEAEDFYQRLVK